MRFQTDHTLWSHDGVVLRAHGQLQAVAGMERHTLPFLRQPKCYRPRDHIDYLVMRVGMRAVYVAFRTCYG